VDTSTGTTTQSLTQLMMPSSDEIARGRRKLHRKAALIAILAVTSYVGLVVTHVGFLLQVMFAAVLVVASVATATSVMHDGNTNVVGFDTDIDQMPFARLAPQQPWKPWHRYQHLYMWVLYGFLTLQWFVLSDYATLVHRKVGSHSLPMTPRKRDVALILFGKLLHLGWAIVLPMMFHPWWGVLGFYLVMSWSVGFLLANIFQLAHCVDCAEFLTPDAPRRGSDFELHQLRTTVDIRCRVPVVRGFVHWLMGGLDYQIEHHLAPKLPHTTYRIAAPKLQAACAERGVDYRVHPSVTAAVMSHARWLRQMGRQP